MTIQRWAKRRDANEQQIIDALRAVGAYVYQDLPVDLLIRYRGVWTVAEVKSAKGKTQKRQERQKQFIETTGCPVIRTVTEALEAIGIIWNGESGSSKTPATNSANGERRSD